MTRICGFGTGGGVMNRDEFLDLQGAFVETGAEMRTLTGSIRQIIGEISAGGKQKDHYRIQRLIELRVQALELIHVTEVHFRGHAIPDDLNEILRVLQSAVREAGVCIADALLALAGDDESHHPEVM